MPRGLFGLAVCCFVQHNNEKRPAAVGRNHCYYRSFSEAVSVSASCMQTLFVLDYMLQSAGEKGQNKGHTGSLYFRKTGNPENVLQRPELPGHFSQEIFHCYYPLNLISHATIVGQMSQL